MLTNPWVARAAVALRSRVAGRTQSTMTRLRLTRCRLGAAAASAMERARRPCAVHRGQVCVSRRWRQLRRNRMLRRLLLPPLVESAACGARGRRLTIFMAASLLVGMWGSRAEGARIASRSSRASCGRGLQAVHAHHGRGARPSARRLRAEARISATTAAATARMTTPPLPPLPLPCVGGRSRWGVRRMALMLAWRCSQGEAGGEGLSHPLLLVDGRASTAKVLQRQRS